MQMNAEKGTRMTTKIEYLILKIEY